MKRHQIMSLTCRALDISNEAPDNTAETETGSKDDLVNPPNANKQVDKGNDSAYAEGNAEIVASSLEDVVSESEEERPIKKRRIHRIRSKIPRKPDANNQVHKANDSADTERNSEIVESLSEDTESEDDERPIKKRRLHRIHSKIPSKPYGNTQVDKGNDAACAESSSEDTESEEERPINRRRIHRKCRIHKKRRNILRKPQQKFTTDSILNSNIARAMFGAAVRIPTRLRHPPHEPYSSAMVHSRNC